MNKEYFVNAVHETALITSLALVHTARRFYRLINKVRNKERRRVVKKLGT